MKRRALLLVVSFFLISIARASLVIPVYWTSEVGHGKKVGTIKADDTIYGLMLTPNLHGLPPGVHGFHIHEVPCCDEYGLAAGGHLDLKRNHQHRGPYQGTGHEGDMPVLVVNKRGNAVLPVLAPRLKLSQITGKAIVITALDDNYSDYPRVDGGGGARILCGEIGYF